MRACVQMETGFACGPFKSEGIRITLRPFSAIVANGTEKRTNRPDTGTPPWMARFPCGVGQKREIRIFWHLKKFTSWITRLIRRLSARRIQLHWNRGQSGTARDSDNPPPHRHTARIFTRDFHCVVCRIRNRTNFTIVIVLSYRFYVYNTPPVYNLVQTVDIRVELNYEQIQGGAFSHARQYLSGRKHTTVIIGVKLQISKIRAVRGILV